MTREEAAKIFRKEIECMSHSKCEDCILEKVCDPMRTTPLDSEYIEAFDMAIKALEQEPFMNKPCVSHQVCHEDKVKVLDKIRAEIKEMPTISFNKIDVYKADVFAIIDKYTAESEDKE